MKEKRIKIIVIGAVGTARNIIDQLIDARNNYDYPVDTEGIIIDSFEKETNISGIPVIGPLKDIPRLLKIKELFFIFALFKPDKLKERYMLLNDLGIPIERFKNFFHPLTYISGNSSCGIGNVVLSNSTIQSNVTMGNFNIINSNVIIEHDTTIGNGNFLAAGSCLGSNVQIRNHCFVGLNSSIRENVNLGNNLYIGMHSLVLNDFTDCLIAGIPAVKIYKR